MSCARAAGPRIPWTPRARGLATAVLFAVAAVAASACSSDPPATLATNCDDTNSQCARYLPGLDSEGAPLDQSTVIVSFTAPIQVAAKPPDLAGVTATFNFETRAQDLKLVPVRALRLDPKNKRQLIIEFDGMLADGAALDLPDGTIRSAKGKSLGPFTVKVRNDVTPFTVGLAGVIWEPTDRTLFSEQGAEKPKGARDEGPVRQELEARLRLRPSITEEKLGELLALYDGEPLKKKVPDHRVRAGLLMLTGTSAEPAIQFILSDTNRRGVPFEPIEVRPVGDFGAFAAVFYHPLIGKMYMWIDRDVARDSLEMIAIVLAHETLHSSLGGGSGTEETIAMAADTRVYQELLLFDPTIVTNPTPLTRTANSLLLTLRNSGRFGFPRAGVLPRPGVDDASRGVNKEPARSFKDLLFKPDFYGEIPKAGDAGSEIVEAYYQRIAGLSSSPGRLKFDQHTLKLFDMAIDHGFTDDQILTIVDALKLRAVPRVPVNP